MLLTVLLFSGALFILLVAGLINGIFEYFKEKKLQAELEKNQKTIISLNSQLNNSMDRNRDYLTENTQFHEDIIKLRKENVELRNSNNEFLKENYRLKDKNKILDETNLKIEQDLAKVIPINRELFAENETLRIELNSKESMITHLKSTVYLRAVLDGTEKPEEINKIHPPIFKTNPPPSVIVKETNGEENKNIPTVN
jgi:septal ring factor EnvC (AmiA/AmiB activator)